MFGCLLAFGQQPIFNVVCTCATAVLALPHLRCHGRGNVFESIADEPLSFTSSWDPVVQLWGPQQDSKSHLSDVWLSNARNLPPDCWRRIRSCGPITSILRKCTCKCPSFNVCNDACVWRQGCLPALWKSDSSMPISEYDLWCHR